MGERLTPGARVGVVGLGAMGLPMARRLLAAGYHVHAHNRTRAKAQALSADGAGVAASPAEAADSADAVLLMLPDAGVVDAVMTGPGGVLQTLASDAFVIDCSSIHPDTAQRLAASVAERGAAMLDAPVSGGQQGAVDGTLSIMVGGDAAAVEACRPLLEVLGRRVTHVGPAGAGQVAKLCNQVIVGVTIEAVAEALTLADRAGADPARVREAMTGGFADSRVLQVHGARMLDGDYNPGGRASLHRKDLEAAVDLARRTGTPLPAAALVLDRFRRLEEAGLGDADHAALVRLLYGEG